jgi:serine phosphatase RsbU (regulator of sigma subunit)
MANNGNNPSDPNRPAGQRGSVPAVPAQPPQQQDARNSQRKPNPGGKPPSQGAMPPQAGQPVRSVRRPGASQTSHGQIPVVPPTVGGPIPPGPSQRRTATNIPAPVMPTPGPQGKPMAGRHAVRARGLSIKTKVILAMAVLAGVIVLVMFLLVWGLTTSAINDNINAAGVGYVRLSRSQGGEYENRLTELGFLQTLGRATQPSGGGKHAAPVTAAWDALKSHYGLKSTGTKPSYTEAGFYRSFTELRQDLEWVRMANACEAVKAPDSVREALLGQRYAEYRLKPTRPPAQLLIAKGEVFEPRWKPADWLDGLPMDKSLETKALSATVYGKDGKKKLYDLAAALLQMTKDETGSLWEAAISGDLSATLVGVHYTPAPGRIASGVSFLNALASDADAGAGASSAFTIYAGVEDMSGESAKTPTADSGVSYSEGTAKSGASDLAIREYASAKEGDSVSVFVNAGVLGEARRNTILWIGLTSAFFIIVSIGVAFLVGTGLTRPVIKLAEDVQIIAGGNFDHRPVLHSRDEVAGLAQLLGEMAQSLKIAQDLWRQNQAQAHDLNMAREIQENLLAKHVPQVKGYDVSAYYSPSKEVGGDYYDFFAIDDNHVGMVCADVSGKGIPGSMIMMMAKSLITYEALANAAPKKLFTSVNRILAKDIKRGMFVTAFYMVLDVPKRVLRYASAGHVPMLVFRSADSKAYSLNPGGIALGFDKDGVLFERNMKEEALQLQQGDRVMIYTDGVIEAVNPAGEEFGERRVMEIMARCAGKSSQDFLVQLVQALETHAQTPVQNDDITIVTFQVV